MLRNEVCVRPSTNDLKSLVWKLQTDTKIKVFLWKILIGISPVTENLNSRGMCIDNTCQVCGELGESTNHTLFLCPLARQIWVLSDFPSPALGFQSGSIFSNVYHLLENKDNREWPSNLRKSFPWILWRIWTNRNAINFEGRIFSALESVQKIREDVLEWFEAQIVEREEVAISSAIIEPGSRTDVCSASYGLNRQKAGSSAMWDQCGLKETNLLVVLRYLEMMMDLFCSIAVDLLQT